MAASPPGSVGQGGMAMDRSEHAQLRDGLSEAQAQEPACSARPRDGQALRESEERFRTLVRFSCDVYWETDAQHRFTRQEFADGLANTPARGAEIGKTRWEVPSVEPDEEGWRRHRALLDAHLPFRDFELARPTVDGGIRCVSVSGVPVFDEAGHFAGYRGVGRDITEHKRAEQERRTHLWFLESMDRVHRATQGTRDLAPMLGDVLDVALQIFACDRAWFAHPCDPEADRWHVVQSRSRPGVAEVLVSPTGQPVDAAAAAVFAAARSAGDAMKVEPGRWLELPTQAADRSPLRSQIVIAIDPKVDRPYLLGLEWCAGERAWTADEQRLLREVGHRLGDGLTSALTLRELRQAELRLRASEARFRTFADHATDGFFLLDEHLAVIDVNRRACDSLGYDRDALIGMRPFDFDAGLDAATIAELAKRAGAGETLTFETLHRRRDGTVFPVEIRTDAFRQAGQQFYLALVRDISERKRAEALLRARQEMLDLAQKAARAVAFDWHIGASERENGWSAELEAMYGLAPGDFDGTYERWKQLVHPDDWPDVRLAVKRAHETGEVAAEYRVVHRDGSVHWLRAQGRMFFDAEGRPERIVGFMSDFTDRRQAQEELRATEHRYRTLVDFAADAFMLHGADGTVIDVNRQACDQLGYSREELIGMHPAVFDAGLGAADLKHVPLRIAAGETVTFETLHRRKDGTVFPVEVRGRQVRQGSQSFGISLTRDITERKRVAEERERLLRLEADLSRVNRVITMGELTASIAHEVNQPLAAMVANAAACERWLSAEPPERHKALRVLRSIADDGRRASAVIGRIRSLMSRQAPRKDRLDINEAVSEVIALVQEQLHRGGVVLSTRLGAEPPLVLGDKVQLQQVLLNLIVNAIEAMSGVGGRPRTLEIVAAPDGPDAVAVEVRDSGTGFGTERAERLFDAFYTTKAEGMGIGLAISRSIIEAHGGTLSAAPNPPHGAVFRFSLAVAG